MLRFRFLPTLLLGAMLLCSCDDTSIGFVTPPARTISSFRLLSPAQDSSIALAPGDSLQFSWEIPNDIGTVARYTLILDRDDTLTNGRILTLELPSVDTVFSITNDTIVEPVGLKHLMPYQTLLNLPAITPPKDTLSTDAIFYTVTATGNTGAVLRSADILKFALTLQSQTRK